MGFYDYADYNRLPSDQKVLWWFDEYLRYDLVFAFLGMNSTTDGVNKFTALVERHSIYNAYAWAEEYSYHLFNLLNITDLLTNEFLNIKTAYKLTYDDVTVTLPPSDEQVVITYFTEEFKHRSVLGMMGRTRDEVLLGVGEEMTVDPEWRKTRAKTDYICYTKHFHIIPPHTAPSVLKIPNVAVYSVVATPNLNNVFPAYLLYENINEWVERLEEPMTIETYTSAVSQGEMGNGAFIKYPDGANTSAVVEDFPSEGTLEDWLANRTFYVPESGSNDYYELPYDSAITSHLIYGFPDGLFNNIYPYYSNSLQYGLDVPYEALINLYLNESFGYSRTYLSRSGSHSGSYYTYNVGFTSNMVDVFGILNGLGQPVEGSSEKYTYYRNLNVQNGFGDRVSGGPPRTPYTGAFYQIVSGPSGNLGWIAGYVYAITWGGETIYTVTPYTWTYNYSFTYVPEPLGYIAFLKDKPSPTVEEGILAIVTKILEGVYVMGFEQKIDEIHACLGAGEFAYSKENIPAYMNMARKLDYVAKALGVCFDLNGGIMSIRNSAEVKQGETIPAGWSFGQFGRNNGGSSVGQKGGLPTDERLGIVYQVKSNQLIANEATGEATEIREGGYVLCETLPQYFAVLERDLDKALDWQDLGAGLVNFNGKTLVVEGLFSFLQEICVVDADTNMTTEQSRISSLITQQLAKEILKGLGLPTQVKKFDFTLQSNDQTWQGTMGGNEIVAEVPYNGVADQSPTISSLILNVLENVALGNIGTLQLNEEEAIKDIPIEAPDPQLLPKKENIFQGALTVLQNWFTQPPIEKK